MFNYYKRYDAKYGNANRGTVRAGREVNVRLMGINGIEKDPSRRIATVGMGEAVGDLTFDEQRGVLYGTKVQRQNGIVIGEALTDIAAFDTWADLTVVDWTTKTPPVGWVTGDALPTISNSIGWIRLKEGSAQVGPCSPYAIKSKASLIGAGSIYPTAKTAPSIVHAFIDPSELSFIYLVMSAPFNNLADPSMASATAFLRVDTSNREEELRVISADQFNAWTVLVGLSREVRISDYEEVGVRMGAAFVVGERPNLPQERRIAFYRHDRGTIALATAQEESITAGQTVVAASYQHVPDSTNEDYRGQRQIPVVKTVGGGSVPTVFEVQDGELITSLNRIGIVRVTATLTDADLPTVTIPPSVPDGGSYVVPAWPMPTGLPSGIGVGKLVGSSTYGFILNDARSSIFWDLVQGDRAQTPAPVIQIVKTQGLKFAVWNLNLAALQL